MKTRGLPMTIDFAIACIASVFSATALIAIVHDYRCDVLNGDYIEGRRVKPLVARLKDRLARAIPLADLREFVALVGWKVRNVSCMASAIVG
jgi:hypothetical protein